MSPRQASGMVRHSSISARATERTGVNGPLATLCKFQQISVPRTPWRTPKHSLPESAPKHVGLCLAATPQILAELNQIDKCHPNISHQIPSSWHLGHSYQNLYCHMLNTFLLNEPTLKTQVWTSLTVQWLRHRLPMQGVWVCIPGQGAKIPQASGLKTQNIKQKQYCNKFNKDFKNGPHKKKRKKKKPK